MGKFYGWVNFMVNKLYLTKDVVKKRNVQYFTLPKEMEILSPVWTI